MAFKNIIIPVLSVAADEPALKAAEIVADMADGHLTAVFLEIEPDPVVAADGYVCGEVWDQISQALAEDARAVKSALERRAWSRRAAIRELPTRLSVVGADFGAIARCADLTVMRRLGQGLDSGIRSELFEAALFKSGRPVLLAPPDWHGGIGRRVFIAWSGKREAARAVADALPFIEGADRVTIATVADEQHPSLDSSEAVAAHLSQHGIKAELKSLHRDARDEGAALLEAARIAEADLIVMGGYGHARATEFIFGGVTRSLSHASPLPVLMSH